MAVARTAAGFVKARALRPGARVAVVAPASSFDRASFEAGCAELTRIGFEPVFEADIFDGGPIVAGSGAHRARALTRAWGNAEIDAVIAVRGGYGSMEVLPHLSAQTFQSRPLPFVGYSDLTSLHGWLNGHLGLTSVHGAMLDGRLARGESAYDRVSFLRALGDEPLGELCPDGLDVLVAGEASGPLVGGTLTQLCASLGTPWDFRPPAGAVMFIEDVSERPYRIRRMLEQLRQSGRLAGVAALVFGQMVRCDEPDGRVTARAVVEEFVRGAGVPVLFGFPSGHTTSPLISLPFGVRARVCASGRPSLVLDEAAAE